MKQRSNPGFTLGPRLARALAAAALLWGTVNAPAQDAPGPNAPAQMQAMGPLAVRSLAQYSEHLRQLQAVVWGCRKDVSLCNPALVGEDDRVELERTAVAPAAPARNATGAAALLAGKTELHARYDWLRDTLAQAGKVDAPARQRLTDDDAGRLDEELREMQGGQAAGFAYARQSADAILARPEFAAVEDTSLWQRALARFFQWLDSFFNGVASFGHRTPWFAPLLEWGSVALASAGLLAWAFRITRRQRLALDSAAEAPLATVRAAVRDWRRAAQERAAAENWREAVHCLYWASIASLETRRLWAPDNARTPREYLGLLHQGAPRQLLEQQTRTLERIWYGLRPAAPQDYIRALAIFEQIEASQ
jgi:hypothetical protein